MQHQVESLQYALCLAQSTLEKTRSSMQCQLVDANQELEALRQEKFQLQNLLQKCEASGKTTASYFLECSHVTVETLKQEKDEMEARLRKVEIQLNEEQHARIIAEQELLKLKIQLAQLQAVVSDQVRNIAFQDPSNDQNCRHDDGSVTGMHKLTATPVHDEIRSTTSPLTKSELQTPEKVESPTCTVLQQPKRENVLQPEERGTDHNNQVCNFNFTEKESGPKLGNEVQKVRQQPSGLKNSKGQLQNQDEPYRAQKSQLSCQKLSSEPVGTPMTTKQVAVMNLISKAQDKAATLQANAACQLNENEIRRGQEAIVDVLASLTAINRRQSITSNQQKHTTKENISDDQQTTSGGQGFVSNNVPDNSQVEAPTSILEKSYMIPDDAAVMKRKLSVSVRRGELNARRALAATRFVDNEVGLC